MPTFGLTIAGLFTPTVTDIREEINARMRELISPTLDLSDRSAEGQLAGIVAEALVLLWENLERVYSSQDPDKATGAALDALCLLTGTFRRPATKSTVVLTLTGDDTTLVPEGSGARIPDGARFDTLADATLVALVAWVTSTSYALGDRVTNGGNAYQCTVAGLSDSGPVSVDPLEDEEDGTVHWRFLGEGTAAVDIDAVATVTGPTIANSATIIEIVTPIGGWNGVVNVLDATVGRNQMSDSELRVFRELELSQPGTSPADAIRAAILLIEAVTSCTVFVNYTDDTNVDGMPPHSVECMVQGGDDQDIFDALLANVAAGIATYGNTSGFATDSEGTVHVENFSRPVEISIYIDITLVKDPVTYPSDGDDQVKAAIVAWGNSQKTGKDAVASGIAAQAFTIAGVLDVTAVLIDDAPSPSTSTTIPVALRELAVYDTSRIAVTSSDGTP